MTKTALILGPGQDGSFLCEILLARGYTVHVMHRRSSVDNLRRIRHLLDRVTLHRGDLTDFGSLLEVFAAADPDEVFNTADQDDQQWSRHVPGFSWDVTSGGVLRILELCRIYKKGIRLFQPVSALMFGTAPPPQDEGTPFDPRSPFACAKLAAYHLCRHYRREHGLFVSCGIMYNHDSAARSEDYVLHKICKAAVRIAQGKQDKLTLGNLDQQIDIGYARDYMEAAVAVLGLPEPDDFVIGTGTAWTIGQMVQEAFKASDLVLSLSKKLRGWTLADRVVVDPKFQRPGPQPTLIANPAKARAAFGFDPPTSISELIRMLVEHEQGTI